MTLGALGDPAVPLPPDIRAKERHRNHGDPKWPETAKEARLPHAMGRNLGARGKGLV